MENMPPLLSSVTAGVRLKHFPRGQILLYQGDEARNVFILRQGVIKIYDIDKQGNEKVLHIVKPPAILPLAFFSGGIEPIHWFYATLTDCDLYELPAGHLHDEMAKNPELTFYLINWFSIEVHELLVRLNSLGKTNARDKVAAALTFLAVKHSVQRQSGWRRVGFAVNHQLIADITGLTRESTAMIMRDFQTKGVIRNPRQTMLEIYAPKLLT